jgi:hypothetical protein
MSDISINLNTNGNPIMQSYSTLHEHPNLGSEVAALWLECGKNTIRISFQNWQEMIDFCEKHNFSYEDNRPAIQAEAQEETAA